MQRDFAKTFSNRTRRNEFKLNESKFRSDIRKKFLTLRVLRQWNRLCRKILDVPSLGVYEASLDGALGKLV